MKIHENTKKLVLFPKSLETDKIYLSYLWDDQFRYQMKGFTVKRFQVNIINDVDVRPM